MTKTFQMDRVIVPAFFVYVEHDHLQHAGARWEGSFRFHRHVYLIPSHLPVQDTISYAIGASFPIGLMQPNNPKEMIKILWFHVKAFCNHTNIVLWPNFTGVKHINVQQCSKITILLSIVYRVLRLRLITPTYCKTKRVRYIFMGVEHLREYNTTFVLPVLYRATILCNLIYIVQFYGVRRTKHMHVQQIGKILIFFFSSNTPIDWDA